jgi:hypothetical protein
VAAEDRLAEHPHGLSDLDFDELFTRNKPVIFAFHAYPWLIHRLTYRRANHDNIHVRGYKEEGTITTPFDMTVLNELDRFHLVMDTIVVDALRTFMLAGSTSTFGLSHDYAVILVTAGTDPITRKPAGRDSPFGRTKSGQAHLQVRGKVATLRRGVHTNHSPTYGGIVACNLSRFDEECELFGPALAPAALLAPADGCVPGLYMGCTRDVHV